MGAAKRVQAAPVLRPSEKTSPVRLPTKKKRQVGGHPLDEGDNGINLFAKVSQPSGIGCLGPQGGRQETVDRGTKCLRAVLQDNKSGELFVYSILIPPPSACSGYPQRGRPLGERDKNMSIL